MSHANFALFLVTFVKPSLASIAIYTGYIASQVNVYFAVVLATLLSHNICSSLMLALCLIIMYVTLYNLNLVTV